MDLNKHPIWEVFPTAETFETFQKNILKPVYFKKEVPDDIKDQAAISEKLLLHSYYEYEFIDIALTQAVFTFEKALRIRWKELRKVEAKANLQTMIDWFFENNFFETRNYSLPHQLRIIRNGRVHNETKSLGGVVFIQKVYETFDLINDLYEPRQMRLLRKEEAHNLTERLSKFTHDGTIFGYGEMQTILYAAYPVFINNKTTPNTLNLLIYPLFDLSKSERGEYYCPPSFTIKVIDWVFDGKMFIATELHTKLPVMITGIYDEVNWGKFQNWQVLYYRLSNWVLLNFETSLPIENLFIDELRILHSH